MIFFLSFWIAGGTSPKSIVSRKLRALLVSSLWHFKETQDSVNGHLSWSFLNVSTVISLSGSFSLTLNLAIVELSSTFSSIKALFYSTRDKFRAVSSSIYLNISLCLSSSSFTLSKAEARVSSIGGSLELAGVKVCRSSRSGCS